MKRDHIRSSVSVMVLAIFAFLAAGSDPDTFTIFPENEPTETNYLGDGVFEEKHFVREDIGASLENYLTERGPRDGYGKWHGVVRSKRVGDGYDFMAAEYAHGVLHGLTVYYASDGTILRKEYYENGMFVSEEISSYGSPPALNSASLHQCLKSSSPIYQQLEKTRPWFLWKMESLFNVSLDQSNSFMGQLGTLIVSANPQGEDELAQVYDGAIEEMGASAQYGEQVKWVRAIQSREARLGLKSLELRLAIFDRIFNKSGSTYAILQSSYPGFLQQMVALGPNLSSIEAFFNDMDTRMDAMGQVDLADPLVAEVIDGRIQAALEQAFQTLLKPAPGPNNGTDDGSESAGKDAYAWSCGGSHSGSEASMVGTPRSTCNQCNGKAYIQFNVDNLPSNVQNVYLGVTHYPHDVSCNSMCSADFYFYPVLDAWSETTIGSGAMPAEGSAVFGPLPISFPNNFGTKEYDITDIYTSWKDGTVSNNGLAIYSPDSGCVNASAMFNVHTSDDPDPALRPYLKAVYVSEEDEPVAIAIFALSMKSYKDSDPVFQAVKAWWLETNQPTAYVSPDGTCGGNTPCYATVQNAISAAENDCVIKIREGAYPENVVMNASKQIVMESGYNAAFSAPGSPSRIRGLVITNGTLFLKGSTELGPP